MTLRFTPVDLQIIEFLKIPGNTPEDFAKMKFIKVSTVNVHLFRIRRKDREARVFRATLNGLIGRYPWLRQWLKTSIEGIQPEPGLTPKDKETVALKELKQQVEAWLKKKDAYMMSVKVDSLPDPEKPRSGNRTGEAFADGQLELIQDFKRDILPLFDSAAEPETAEGPDSAKVLKELREKVEAMPAVYNFNLGPPILKSEVLAEIDTLAEAERGAK